MMQTFVRPSRDLRNHYAEISEMLKLQSSIKQRKIMQHSLTDQKK